MTRPSAHRVEVANRQRGYRIDRERITRLVRFVLHAERTPKADVEVAIVSDREIADIHQRFLGQRGATDVMSFELSAAPLEVQIIVSADTARRQARQFGHSIAAELSLYIVHGLLHQLGYDDVTPDNRKRMQTRQRELVEQFGMTLRA